MIETKAASKKMGKKFSTRPHVCVCVCCYESTSANVRVCACVSVCVCAAAAAMSHAPTYVCARAWVLLLRVCVGSNLRQRVIVLKL